MLVETVLLSVLAMTMGAFIWKTWQQRELERERAQRNERLALMGRDADDLAHDLSSYLSAVMIDLHLAEVTDSQRRLESIQSAQALANVASELLRTIRREAGTVVKDEYSVENIVRGSVAAAQRYGDNVELHVKRPVMFQGPPASAIRVVHNLLTNAILATRRAAHGTVVVELDEEMRFRNPLPAGERIDERLFERGVSGVGSSGSGLAIAMHHAAQVGWEVHCKCENGEVVLSVGNTEKRTETS